MLHPNCPATTTRPNRCPVRLLFALAALLLAAAPAWSGIVIGEVVLVVDTTVDDGALTTCDDAVPDDCSLTIEAGVVIKCVGFEINARRAWTSTENRA